MLTQELVSSAFGRQMAVRTGLPCLTRASAGRLLNSPVGNFFFTFTASFPLHLLGECRPPSRDLLGQFNQVSDSKQRTPSGNRDKRIDRTGVGPTRWQ
jgi:hypothetical protein